MLRKQPLQCCFSCFLACIASCIASCIARCIHNRQLILHNHQCTSRSIIPLSFFLQFRLTIEFRSHSQAQQIDDRSMLPSICSFQLLFCLCSNHRSYSCSMHGPVLRHHDTIEQLLAHHTRSRHRNENRLPNLFEPLHSADRQQDDTNEQPLVRYG